MKKTETELLSALFCVASEAVSEKGEDSFCYANQKNKTLISVFDGCGGIGAKRYALFREHTGAYVAARAVSGGIHAWFKQSNGDCKTLKSYIQRALSVCKASGDGKSRLLGSLNVSFPTTVAGLLVQSEQKKITADCFYAGDSRCYLLDADGLHQLSEDDVAEKDAFANLAGDGALTNVLQADKDFVLHEKHFTFKTPCVLFAATDGCFAYFKTPMHFEDVLLRTLVGASNIEEWKRALYNEIAKCAGDDFTLCLAAYGFSEFDAMKRFYTQRAGQLQAAYLADGDAAERKWKKYKRNYNKFR